MGVLFKRSCWILFYLFIITVPGVSTASKSFSKAPAETVLEKMVEKFDSIINYSAVITTSSGTVTNKMHYFYQKPGYTKMVFIEPHEGATLAYNPITGKALLKPFKSIQSLSLSLSPDNRLITSPFGHTIDKSHMGVLLKTMTKLSKHGKVEIISEVNDSNYKRIIVELTGINGFSVNKINRYTIKLDTKRYFPTEVQAYSAGGELIEHMALADLAIDADFSVGTFD